MSNNNSNQISKSFCVLPWIHLNVQPNGDIYPCCMAPYGKSIGNTTDNTLEEIWNGDDMKTIRKEMLVGERPKLCERCFLIEDSGLLSPRNTHNHFFDKDVNDLIKDTNPETGHNDKFVLKYWDFRWSNICNFKCRMCGVFSSSKWYEDEGALYGTVLKNNGLLHFNGESKEDIFNCVDRFINDVEEIYFAGGEPLIMDEHYIILEKLIAAGRTNVRIRYNTNFSHIKFKKWDLHGLWSHFLNDPNGRIMLFASLDAVGKLAEVIRNGTKWNSVYENIKSCVDKGMEVHISPTISILNIFHINELIDMAITVGVNPNTVSLNNLLTTPPWYDIRILPENLKKDLMDKLRSYLETIESSHVRSIVRNAINAWERHLNTPFDSDIEDARRHLVRSTYILDERRNEKFLDVNPQYREWFAQIEETIVDKSFLLETKHDDTII
jgi:radical SAM protein with 4Fe4S-binding SPASM domain